MNKAGKIVCISLFALCALLAVGITFTVGWRPFLGPKKRALTNRQFELTPERVARGRHLVEGILNCEMCHSPKDWNTHGAPNLAGMELAGQVVPVSDLPGTITASNITPDRETGGGNWSDDAFARAIREGIGHDGRTIFPMIAL
jgi:hypothetical protein